MISRVELMNKIAYSHDEIVSPRIQSKVQANASINLPSDEEILNAMVTARSDALKRAADFGMNFNVGDITACEANLRNENLIDDMEGFDDEDENEFEIEINIQQNEKDKNTAESNSYVEVVDVNGSIDIIPKSALVWMLSDSNEKLSSDRQKRVQTRAADPSNSSRNKKMKPNFFCDDHQKLRKLDELQIGDWAVFIAPNPEQPVGQQVKPNFLIGFVLGFRYINEKKRIFRCKSNYVSTKASPTEKQTIESLIMPYSPDKNGVLSNTKQTQIAIDMKNYVANINSPTTKKNETSNNFSYVLQYKYSELESEVKLALMNK